MSLDINLAQTQIYHLLFDGWGTSIAWWGFIGNSEKKETVDYLTDIIFNQKNKEGLQLNVVRYNIGGVLPTTNTSGFRKGAAVEGYQDGKDWTNTDPGQRYFLKKSKEYGANIFESFANSPRGDMTKNGRVDGNDQRLKNNLKYTSEDEFVKNLCDITSYLSTSDGIPFSSISPINEPSGPAWIPGTGQEGCFYGFLGIRTRVMKKLKACSSDLKVTAFEENNMLQAIIGLITHPFSWKYIDNINVHRYTIGNALGFNTGGVEDANILRRVMHFFVVTLLRKRLWMSEWGMGNVEKVTDPLDHMNAIAFATKVMDDLIYLKPTGWLYWQAIEDFSGKEGGGWGLLQIPFNDLRINQIRYSAQFRAFQHFTHYIKEGSKLLLISQPWNSYIKLTGCLNTDGSYSLVILSTYPEEYKIVLNKAVLSDIMVTAEGVSSFSETFVGNTVTLLPNSITSLRVITLV
jgi:hypothetical protein